jgi:hypothetical protein
MVSNHKASPNNDALKQDGPLATGMGLEMIGLLVHQPTLERLLAMTWDELNTAMANGALRDERPPQDGMLTTTFAIDAEAEWLDWVDDHAQDAQGEVRSTLASMADGPEGLLHLMRWASPGQWEVWEGRAFLYLEAAIGREAKDIHELYTEGIWNETLERLHGIAEDEFAERVVLGWMDRRKELGETLEESEDPKIVPTFEAHTRASKALVHTVNRAVNESELALIVGREHLEAEKWGHGSLNLSVYLQTR